MTAKLDEDILNENKHNNLKCMKWKVRAIVVIFVFAFFRTKLVVEPMGICCLLPLFCTHEWVNVLIEMKEQNNQPTDSYLPICSLKLVKNESKSHCTIPILSHYLQMQIWFKRNECGQFISFSFSFLRASKKTCPK